MSPKVDTMGKTILEKLYAFAYKFKHIGLIICLNI